MIYPISFKGQASLAPKGGACLGAALTPQCWAGALSATTDRPELDLPLALQSSSPLFSTAQPLALRIRKQAQNGVLILPGHRAGWLGAQSGLEIRSPSLHHSSALAWTRGPTRNWHATLSQSCWAFWINSPAVVLKSRSTKGPPVGRGGGGNVGSPVPCSQ